MPTYRHSNNNTKPILNQFVTSHLYRHIQIMKHFLQQDTLAVIIFISESGTNTLQDKLCGTVQCHRQTVSLHQRTGDDTGESIARAGIMRRQIRTSHFPIAVSLTVISIDRRFMRLIMYRNTGNDNDLRTFIG